MKSSDEMVNDLIRRRDEYFAGREKKRRAAIRSVGALCSLALVVAVGFGLWKGWRPAEKETNGMNSAVLRNSEINQEYPASGVEGNGDVNAPPEEFPNSAVPGIAAPPEDVTVVTAPGNDGGEEGPDEYSVGGSAWFNIPRHPPKGEIAVVGEELTDADASAWFAENQRAILTSLGASGVSAEGAVISKTGYCHVSYDGTEGKAPEVRRNFRDYPVFRGDRLIAIVTLVKENGAISATPSFGAPWFDAFSDFLAAHRDEKLLFVYAGFTEIVVAPDDTAVCPLNISGISVADTYFQGLDDPYSLFYNDYAVYVRG